MYKFQVDDLVICKPAEQERDDSNRDFEIFARVAEVDRDRDTVRLDCYQKQGRLHLESRIKQELSLSELEHGEFYQPLNNDEVLDFRDGLCDLLTSTSFRNNLFSMDVQATFDLANEAAEEIEHDRKRSKEME